MTPWTSGRPDQSEFAAYAAMYVDLVEGNDLVKALTTQLQTSISLLQSVSDTVAGSYSYAPGKWTMKEVLGHITDTERIFGYRALCVARADAVTLPGFEQEDYVKASGVNSRSLGDLLDELQAVRRATIAFFAGLPPEAWLRRGTVNQYSVTVRGLAFHAAGHELHHMKVVKEKYLSSAHSAGAG